MSCQASPSFLHPSYFVKIFLLLVLYLLAAKLGFFMKEGSEYADLIWPPCGLAIAMLITYGWRIWPGVFLGSFLVHIWLSKAAFSTESTDLVMGSAIGIGSTLQALIGYFLLKRYIGFPLSLVKIQEQMSFFAGSALFASLFSSSIGILTLYVAGALNGELLFTNALTWWLGDSIGIFVFVPLSLIMLAKLKQGTCKN